MNFVYKFFGTLFYFVAYPICYSYFKVKSIFKK